MEMEGNSNGFVDSSKNQKQVYIQSLEANDIYCHMLRGKNIKSKYCGMIPFSLELMKLKKLNKEGFSTRTVKHSGKEISDDLINIKFSQKVKSGEFILEKLVDKINKMKDNLAQKEAELEEAKTDAESIVKLKEYIQKLVEFKEVLETEKNLDKWQEVSNEALREYLYLNGFTITDVEGKQTEYVVYKRSSAKSRTGQCLFIKKSLYDEMINWSRMYLPFQKDMEIDYASLLAYESLVLSSLEDTIQINPKNILIVDDVESKFNQLCNVVRTDNKTGLLDSFQENEKVKNSLFDGESLLDARYYADGQSMKLLRNHMFKSAAFNTNIQQFLQDALKRMQDPEDVLYDESLVGITYDQWEIPNMFNEPIYAKDTHLIVTPSSLKCLKFSHVIGTEKDMWNHWKKLVAKENNTFGVCKSEKKSKRGVDQQGNVLQQTSYQMINSMPMEEADIVELLKFEKDYYIDKLKNNDDFFIQHIMESASDINSNMMFADLYKRNKNIVHTKIFRDFRKAEINKHVTHVKKGKIRLIGDYSVLLGNPMEFLYHAIGKLNLTNPALKDNEIYTTLFPFGKELVGFRNPHTSQSNVLVAKNTYNEEIEKYFNLSSNIVCVNGVDFAIQDILSSCDYDSDTMALFDDSKLLELGKKCFGKYRVCINKVGNQKRPYKLNNMDMSIIDNQLAQSQKFIGRVVNLGQLAISLYWDKRKDGTEKVLEGLLKQVDIMTVFSTICIDLSKKLYELDIENEIKNVESQIKAVMKFEKIKNEKGKVKHVKKKPNFFRYVSESDTIKNRIMHYDCPMDYLYRQMSNLKYANRNENVNLKDLLVKRDRKKGNREQENKILDYVEAMCQKINEVYSKYEDEEERNNVLVDIVKYYHHRAEKLTLKPDTMYSIIMKMIENKTKSKLTTKLMNTLYTTQKEVFLQAFKEV